MKKAKIMHTTWLLYATFLLFLTVPPATWGNMLDMAQSWVGLAVLAPISIGIYIFSFIEYEKKLSEHEKNLSVENS